MPSAILICARSSWARAAAGAGEGERTRVTGHVCPCVPAAIWAARSEHRQTTSAFAADGSGRRQAHEKGTYSGCPVAHGAEE